MSNYLGKAFNPKTGQVEDAKFLDNYYGRHRYGVRFADGAVYPEDFLNWPGAVVLRAPETKEG